MTGETDPVHKNILKHCLSRQQEIEANGEKNVADKHEVPTPIMMSGTKVLSGEGLMLIIVVGPLSCIGKIRELVDQEDPEPTPLQ
jgi:magnesium-transporting ATPase (P-type)